MWKGKEHSVGINFRRFENISDKSVLTRDSMSAGAGGSDVQQSTVAGNTDFFDEMNNDVLRIGYAFQGRSITWSTDIIYYSPVSGNSDQQELLSGYDLGTGFEARLGFITTRIGIFTNNSLYKVPEEGLDAQSHHIDYLGYSFGLALPRKTTESTVGVIYQNGTGLGQKVAGTTEIQDVTAKSFLVVLGSTYEF